MRVISWHYYYYLLLPTLVCCCCCCFVRGSKCRESLAPAQATFPDSASQAAATLAAAGVTLKPGLHPSPRRSNPPAHSTQDDHPALHNHLISFFADFYRLLLGLASDSELGIGCSLFIRTLSSRMLPGSSQSVLLPLPRRAASTSQPVSSASVSSHVKAPVDI